MSEGMTPAERHWLLAQVSTDAARRVLALMTCHAGACTAAFLAGSSGVGLAETREILARALVLGLAEQHSDLATATTRYTITGAGRDHLADPVIDDDASAIVVDDQPSSTPTTGVARRGKPAWCTPGSGACLYCKEGS